MINDTIFILGIAGVIGLVIGVERRWRGFEGSVPFHIAPALVGAWLAIRQPGLTHLFWFLPLQILMWLVVTAIVCMWSAERTPDVRGDFRGSGGIGLSWTLAFLLGAAPFRAEINPEVANYGDYDQLMRLEEWYGRDDG